MHYSNYSQIAQPPGQSYPISDEEAWMAQYENGPVGATAIVPIHTRMKNNPAGLMEWWERQDTMMKAGIAIGAIAAAYFIWQRRK